jgi:hypothetical protein
MTTSGSWSWPKKYQLIAVEAATTTNAAAAPASSMGGVRCSRAGSLRGGVEPSGYWPQMT